MEVCIKVKSMPRSEAKISRFKITLFLGHIDPYRPQDQKHFIYCLVPWLVESTPKSEAHILIVASSLS